MSGAAKAENDYTSVEFWLLYYGNGNAAYFDNAQLIKDTFGNTYTYDEWGKVLTITGDQANTIGQLNPIRYRGYYYDAETGFYYCRSRYYDPEICRWINGDGQMSGIGGELRGHIFFLIRITMLTLIM